MIFGQFGGFNFLDRTFKVVVMIHEKCNPVGTIKCKVTKVTKNKSFEFHNVTLVNKCSIIASNRKKDSQIYELSRIIEQDHSGWHQSSRHHTVSTSLLKKSFKRGPNRSGTDTSR